MRGFSTFVIKLKWMRFITSKYSLYFLILAINIFLTKELNGQFFSFGTDPARARWSYIQSDNYRVIYPDIVDSLAQRYLYLLEVAREPVLKSVNTNPRRVDVILHPYSTISNGMVGLAPRRMEFITTPPPSRDYAHNWEKHLTIHELRHLGQIAKFEKGIFRPLSWLLGEQSFAIGVGVYMNQWTLEGDAIVSETELTSAGRGRDPDHLMYYRAAFLNGDFRKWQNWTLGSYKKYVPDVYSFGYLFHSFVRSTSGNYYYMDQVTDYVIRNFYDVNSLDKGYKKYTGFTKKGHFEQIKRVMTERWREEDSLRSPFSRSIAVNEKASGFTSYQSPADYNDTLLFAIKKDLNRRDRLVSFDQNGRESFLRYMGMVNSPLTISNGKIYWTEYIYSKRWELESFSDIFSYNIATGVSKRETIGERLFNISFTPEGDSIIATHYSPEGNSSLVLFNREEMTAIDTISFKKGQIKESVSLSGYIYSTVVTDRGTAIYSYSIKTKKWNEVVSPQGKAINNLKKEESCLWFISDLNGVNNVYSLNPETLDLEMKTNLRFGTEGFSLGSRGESLYVSDFSHSGYNLAIVNRDSLSRGKSSFLLPYDNPVAMKLSEEASLLMDTLQVPDNPGYQSLRFRKGANLFRFHSWAPLYYNVDNIKNLTYETVYDVISPGFILYSQNSLNTAYTMAGYSYRKGFHSGHLSFTYYGFYPVIEVKGSINERERISTALNIDEGYQQRDTIAGSPYLNSSVLIYVPFNLSSGGWRMGFVPRLSWRYTNDSFFSYKREREVNYNYLSAGVSFYRYLAPARREIFPRFGIGALLEYSAVPLSGENFGSLLYGAGYIYLPGVAPAHGLRLSAAFQNQFIKGKNYLMNNVISFPEGYDHRYSKRAVAVRAEYAMPLLTQDISITKLLYLKRIQLIPFVSYCRNTNQFNIENLTSYGSDIIADINVFGISYPLALGVRAGVTAERTSFIQILFKTPL